MKIDNRYTGLNPDWHLNSAQETLVPHMDHANNLLVCFKTSAGKSIAIPMFGMPEIDEGRILVYVAPFKALAEEKIDEWQEEQHPFKNLPSAAITGDYTYDAAKIESIRKAKVISITPESLTSVIRNQGTDKARFLPKIGIIVVDEAHLAGAEGRGANLEVALIELLHDFPEIRLVFLSATVPNAEHVAQWMSNLNGYATEIATSPYRPVELERHFVPYPPGRPADTDQSKIRMVKEIVMSDDKKDQQFLVGVMSKALGRKIKDNLIAAGVRCDFHNGDIKDRNERKAIEKAFKGKSLRVLVSTSTLFAGVNLPARNVICTSVEAGGGDVQACDLQQLEGRAGRPGYDTEGTVFFLLPKNRADYHRERILKGEPVVSQLTKIETLATHFIGAVYMGRIATKEDFAKWYSRTLAYVQNSPTDDDLSVLLDGVVKDMSIRGILKVEEGTIKLLQLGKIAAQMLIDPYHISDLTNNLTKFFSLANQSDAALAKAIGSCRPYEQRYVSELESKFIPKALVTVDPRYVKHCSAAYYRLTEQEMPGVFSGPWWGIYDDLGRMGTAMTRVCSELTKWKETTHRGGVKKEVDATERVRLIFIRLQRSCDWERARAFLSGLSKAEIRTLKPHGIDSLDELRNNMDLAHSLFKPKRLEELGLT